MKIYIDLGAYNGDTIKWFKNSRVDSAEYKIYAFDPAFPEKPDIIHKAVGTYDGTVKFAFNAGRTMASTIETDNILFNTGPAPFHRTRPEVKDNKVEYRDVEIIDFPKWFKGNFNHDDYIVLKIDIEGSEFPILEKMIEDNLLGWVDELFCEFHTFHLGIGYIPREEEIKSKIKELGIKFRELN